VVLIVAGCAYLLQDRARGAATPEELADRYLSAMRSGNTFAVAMLTRSDHPIGAGTDERMARYREIGERAIDREYLPHSVASYLMGVRFTVSGERVDEIALQQMGSRLGSRWYLVAFPPP
jgi:hypothetical protein